MNKSTALIEACRVGLVAMAMVWNAGCGGGTSASAGDAGADSDVAGDAGTDTGATPADGGGVCCEYSTSCSCLGGGGWAASASACVPATSSRCAADGLWHFETDSHGCQSVVTGTGPNCCGCAPLDNGDAGDSGDAGSTDAAVDTSCPANFCACTCQDGGAGYRPQCDAVHCTSTDPCISGLAADGGWLVCGT